MSPILEFIKIFQSPINNSLFKDCACYYFARILQARFPYSTIMYDPHQIHFAVRIVNNIYDITGIVENPEDYVEWEEYADIYEDADMVLLNCVKIERR